MGSKRFVRTNESSENRPVRTLRFAEWILSGSIVVRVLLLTLNEQIGYELRLGDYLLFGALATLLALSFFFPGDRPMWQRRLYIFFEIVCLLLVRAFSGWGLDIYLSLVFVKSCFLLRRRDVAWMTVIVGIAWHASLARYLTEMYSASKAELKAGAEAYLSMPTQYIVLDVIANNVIIYISLSFLAILLSMTVLAERESRKQAVALAKEVETLATDLERNRIARDIHDSLGHTLTAMNMQLEVAQTLSDRAPAESAQALQRAKTLSGQSLQEVRRAVSVMRGGTFDLPNALMTLAAQTEQTSGIDVQVQLDLPELPLQVSQQLYMVIKEGLMNVQKHSKASTVLLSSWTTNEAVAIELSDDGVGFPLQASSHGFGIRGMRERIGLISGQLRIHSDEKEGTRLWVRIPLA